ncbi:MAG: hypothetical protein ACFBRM_14955 [Pikeienuella sp.]
MVQHRSRMPKCCVIMAVSALLAFGLAARAQTAQNFSLLYLPDEQKNLICFSRGDALDLLTQFRELYMAEARPRVARLLRGFSDDFGQNRRYDCSFIVSIYVPTLPVDAIDLVQERGLDWGDDNEYYFVAATLLVGETKYTQTATGGSIYVFTSDAVIRKE